MIKLFVEGGGGPAGKRNNEVRTGFESFLRRALDGYDMSAIHIVCFGGVNETVIPFIDGLKSKADPNGLDEDEYMILIDSDLYLTKGADRVAHLLNHPLIYDAHKKKLANYTILPNQVFFMVQEIEAWFLSDGHALSHFYSNRHKGVQLVGLPSPSDVATIAGPKEFLIGLAKNAGASYHETKDASIILTDYLDHTQVAVSDHYLLLLDELKRRLPSLP